MFSSTRDSLTWLHTWGGVFLGSVLFAVFWMGTLSVFDREIDRWMNPESRLKTLNEDFSLDIILLSARRRRPARRRTELSKSHIGSLRPSSAAARLRTELSVAQQCSIPW